MKKIKEKNKVKKIEFPVQLFFLITITSLLLTTIGYSAMNTSLNISGDAVFMPDNSFFVDFEYKGSCEEYVIPLSGIYKLETWGASGGNSLSGMSGKGGYSAGTITLAENNVIYVCVGGEGKNGSASGNQILAGGFNGGGNAWGQGDGNNGSGGGGTDIRIGYNSLYSRVLVAGGGGGAVSAGSGSQIGHGGGTSGLAGITNFGGGCTAGGGTQTSGGAGNTCGSGFVLGNGWYNASFGVGGNGRTGLVSENRSGGGGGWYGGGSSFVIAGGGSGFALDASSISNTPSGYTLTDMHYLSDIENINGANSIPTHDKTGMMNGNSGDGFAKITYIGGVNEEILFYLNGSADMQISVGGTYTEQGATLYINGINYSSSIITAGTVTTSTAGTYTKTYTYTYNSKVYKLVRRILVQNPISYTQNFSYTGASQSASVPYTGWYKIEVWGAQGGKGQDSGSGTGGSGGYSVGTVWISAGTTIYAYVGGQGLQYSSGNYSQGAWNGGGHGGEGSCSTQRHGGSGGGATDIRIGGTSLYYRLIVAGGGGGGSGRTSINGGAGGDSSGTAGAGGAGGGQGGTQNAGGNAATAGINDRAAVDKNGSFGQGGHSNLVTGGGLQKGSWTGGGGGGGWYGGGAGSNSTTPLLNCNDNGEGGAGGGGSGFIFVSGASVPGSYAVSTSYYMAGTSMTVGSRTGNGYATITYVQ